MGIGPIAIGGATTADRRGVALAVLCLAPFLGVFDTSVVALALPALRRELGFSDAGVQWVLNGYTLAFGGLLLLGGHLADVLGRRRVFVAGLGVFALASLGAGLAVAPWMLVAARVAQGIGAAALGPASLALVTTTFSAPSQRNRAVGAYGAMAGLGFVAGVALGGAITDLLGWRWVLLANAPLALAALLATPAVVPESRDPGAPRSLDLAGAATATFGMAALIYALAMAPGAGWTAWPTLGGIFLGIALLGGFILVERRTAAPLVPLGVFRNRRLAVADAALLLKSTVGMAQLYVLTLYFQEVLGRTPLQAGLLFVPMALASVAAAATAGRLVTRLGVRPTAGLGLALLTVGLLLMTRLRAEGGLETVLVGTVVAETGFMLAHVPLTVAATTSLPARHHGLAAGLLGVSVQLGNALGLALVAALVAVRAGEPGAAADPASLAVGLQSGLFAVVAAVAVTLLLVFVGLRGRTRDEAEAAGLGREHVTGPGGNPAREGGIG